MNPLFAEPGEGGSSLGRVEATVRNGRDEDIGRAPLKVGRLRHEREPDQ